VPNARPPAPRAPATSPSAAALLRRHGLRPRKGLGQHFLVSRGVLLRIAEAAGLAPDDTVIEVGPGTGALTRELAARAGRVIAIEKDAALAEALRQELAALANVRIVTGDALELDPASVLREHGATGPYKVVANLPYYAANPIVRRFLESAARPTVMVVLLQREVAASMAARPGAMSILSVAVQLRAVPAIIGIVKGGSFYPPPKVDSAIVRLEVRPAPAIVPEAEAEALMEIVRAGFSAPRKQVANALARALGLARERAVAALSEAKVNPRRRAATLTLEEWGVLYRALRPRP